MKMNTEIKVPPVGLGILLLLGPSLVWFGEFVGSGEVILATRTGAILGPAVLWALVLGIFLKYWIGMSGAHYTVCTGEGMIDMCSRVPGPKNWAVWTILFGQFASAMIAIGSLAAAAGVFISSLVPVTPYIGGWFVTIFSLVMVWSGGFNILKSIMSFFVFFILIGVIVVTIRILPEIVAQLQASGVRIPDVPEWALQYPDVVKNPWREILPLMGWAAGGFASQVWYTYWVLGAGYGAARGREYGVPADTISLKMMTVETAAKIKGWCKVVYTDATLAMVLGVLCTSGFLLAGAGILGVNKLAPSGPDVALTLSTIFSQNWGAIGGTLFLVSGAAALIGTQIGQLAGWPRLLADCLRICLPGFAKRFEWKIQFRMLLLFFFTSNMIIVYSLGLKPVLLVKIAAVLDGLLLTPLQAVWIAMGLYIVLPKLLSDQARPLLKPGPILLVGLIAAFLVFGYFCVFQIPYIW